jgi:thiamine-phosphate pyrophosphorylase
MKPRKNLLKKSHLYLIADKTTAKNESLEKITRQIKKSKVNIVQLRAKDARINTIVKTAYAMQKELLDTKILFIINDYPDIAKIVGADGVHIGQDDVSIQIARDILGKDKIIGVSCHSLKQAILAQRKGADYVALGPVFPTPTKPKTKAIGLKTLGPCKEKIKIPIFAIGSINRKNLQEVLAQGAKNIAVCRAILRSKNKTKTANSIYRNIVNYNAIAD